MKLFVGNIPHFQQIIFNFDTDNWKLFSRGGGITEALELFYLLKIGIMKKDCWLTQDGNIIECIDSHNMFAFEFLIEEMGGEKELYEYMDKNNISCPYQILHKRGWVRIKYNGYLPKIEILGNCIDLTKPMRNTINPSMNERQMNIAKELCDNNEEIFYQAINDKRFW